MNLEEISLPSFSWKKFVSWLLIGLVAIGLWISWFITPEGSVDVVNRFGQAHHQELPGLHFKIPFAETVTTISAREQKNEETMIAGTKEQMQLRGTKASVNWRVLSPNVIHMYQQFGSIKQLEQIKLDPLFLSSVKTGLGRYAVADLVGQRDDVASTITEILKAEIAAQGLPIEITGMVNIEDFGFPPSYEQSILAKQNAKELDLAEVFNLAKADKISQRTTKQAEADRDAAKANADGEKYRIDQVSIAQAASIEREGNATAGAIKAQTIAMAGHPLFVEYTRWKNWDGALPKVQLGSQQDMIVDLNKLSEK